MATRQHSTITDPDIHEPKGVAAASSRDVYAANGSGSGNWTNIDEMVDTGWAYYEDSTHTTSTPLAVTATAQPGTQITIDNDTASESNKPSSSTSSLWNDTTNKIQPIADGDAYSVRLSMTAEDTTGLNYAVLYLDVGGSTGIIYENPILFPAGDGTKVSIDFTIRVNSDFLTNGGSLHIYKDGGTLELKDFSILITRLHRGG